MKTSTRRSCQRQTILTDPKFIHRHEQASIGYGMYEQEGELIPRQGELLYMTRGRSSMVGPGSVLFWQKAISIEQQIRLKD